MTHHGLVRSRVPCTNGLVRVDKLPQLLLLFVCELNIPRRPVLFQTLQLGRSGNGNHALGSDPCQGNLGRRASLLGCQCLNLGDNRLVLVKIVALELGTRKTEVSRGKLLG